MRRFVYYNAASAGASLLLDLYPATAAYSLRKLRTAYSGAAIRVRRASDNAEQDIGFVGNDFDVASFNSFVGASTAWVVKHYNQGSAGSIHDVSQSMLSSQFQMTASQILTDTSTGSKPPMILDGEITNIQTVFSVSQISALTTINYLLGREEVSPILAQGFFLGGSLSGVNGLGGFNGINIRSNTGEDLLRHLGYWNLRAGNIYNSKNGGVESNLGTFSSAIRATHLFGRVAVATIYMRGIYQELVIYTNDQSANRTAIESNINSYYGIYP